MEKNVPAIRAPLQNRSRKTLARLVAAARKLLENEGVEGVTVQAVVARAGASVGSFYARFSGKEDLLAHLQDTVWADVGSWWDDALAATRWEGRSIEETADQVVRLLTESRRSQAAGRASLRARPEGREAERRFDQRTRESLRAAILSGGATISHTDPPVAVDLALRAVTGVLRDLDEDPSGADGPAALERELGRLFVAYLGRSLPASEGGSPPNGVDYFDVWG